MSGALIRRRAPNYLQGFLSRQKKEEDLSE
jgi:hypothetical protein